MILITRPKEDNDKLSILLSKKNIRHKKENLTSFRILKKKIECHRDKVFLVASKQAVRSLSQKKNKIMHRLTTHARTNSLAHTIRGS